MTEPVALLPRGLRVTGRPVTVVGGGAVAARRVATLLAAGAVVTVVSPEVTAELRDQAAAGRLAWQARCYVAGDVGDAWLVFACTSDAQVNAAVADEAESRRLFCGRADDATRGTAWMPAVGRTGAFTIAVHADRDPRRAAGLRDLLVRAAERADLPPARPRGGQGSG